MNKETQAQTKGNKLKPFDFVLIAIIAAIVIIIGLVVTGKNNFAKTPVEKTDMIEFQVMFKSVSLTDNHLPFVVGEKSFITIRNVPYTELEITQVQYAPKKYILEVPNPKTPFVLIDDPTQPFQYDFIITLKDEAKITADGAVVGGNKMKIGMPIVLEGYNYRLGGTVSNVIIPGKTQKTENKQIQPAQSEPQKTDISKAPQKEIKNTGSGVDQVASTATTETESKDETAK